MREKCPFKYSPISERDIQTHPTAAQNEGFDAPKEVPSQCDAGLVKSHNQNDQACQLKFRLRELTSCFYSAAASTACFEGQTSNQSQAWSNGLGATETGNELSHPKSEFTNLVKTNQYAYSQCPGLFLNLLIFNEGVVDFMVARWL